MNQMVAVCMIGVMLAIVLTMFVVYPIYSLIAAMILIKRELN